MSPRDGRSSLPKESRTLLSPKNPPLHTPRPCQGNPVSLELFIPLPVLLQRTIPSINMPRLFILLGFLSPLSKLTPSWRCSAAFLGFPDSNPRLQPFPVGSTAGTAPGTGTAGLDPAGAPAFGSTSQPAWPWNAGKASSSARKNPERGNRAGNSREKLGIVLCEECWRQSLAALRAEARPGCAPRGAASLCLPPGSAPGIALLGAVPGLLRSLEMDQSVQRILSPSSRRSVGIRGA